MEPDALAALGAQYINEVDALDQMITACKEHRELAIDKGNSREATRLERLADLYYSPIKSIAKSNLVQRCF